MAVCARMMRGQGEEVAGHRASARQLDSLLDDLGKTHSSIAVESISKILTVVCSDWRCSQNCIG